MAVNKLSDEDLEEVSGGLTFNVKKTQTSNVKFSTATRETPSSSCDKFELKLGGTPGSPSICKNCKYYSSQGVDSGVCNNTNKGEETGFI